MFAFLGNSIGDCTIDSFVVSSPGNVASPAICGFNSKQHSNLKKIILQLMSTSATNLLTTKPYIDCTGNTGYVPGKISFAKIYSRSILLQSTLTQHRNAQKLLLTLELEHTTDKWISR